MSHEKHQPKQLQLRIERAPQPDRNLHKGGRSFYLFDFDDNVMCLGTRIYLFDRENGAERAVSTAEFARVQEQLGKEPPWDRYEARWDDTTGSFRDFRDRPGGAAEQPFVVDLTAALQQGPQIWHGPSWEIFSYAVHNARPVSIITARGHHPDTLKHGIELLHTQGHLPHTPNYLSLFPVSHPATRAALGDTDRLRSTAELKKEAIIRSVHAAMEQYGFNEHHRFGMSDDDPSNLTLILAALHELKAIYPANSFFLFDTSQQTVVRNEILIEGEEQESVSTEAQLSLFEAGGGAT